jgi:hypothetical protein
VPAAHEKSGVSHKSAVARSKFNVPASMSVSIRANEQKRESKVNGHEANDELLELGWREWVGLPELGIRRIKAKVDTGARTSALHAFAVEPFTDGGIERVRFKMHPMQKNDTRIVVCTADVVDQRLVSDSGGHREQRYVIRTAIRIGDKLWPSEITLTARDDMMFRMLLGRTAIAGRGVVHPGLSYVQGKRHRSTNAT